MNSKPQSASGVMYFRALERQKQQSEDHGRTPFSYQKVAKTKHIKGEQLFLTLLFLLRFNELHLFKDTIQQGQSRWVVELPYTNIELK